MKNILLFVALLQVANLCAQEPGVNTSTPVQERIFGTQVYMTELLKTNPELRQSISNNEVQTFNYRYSGTPDTVTIPVVFHLVGVSAITPGDILKQLECLNNDFYTPRHPYTNETYRFALDAGALDETGKEILFLHPADQKQGFAQKAALPMIRFCLPESDPSGNPTNGIIQVASDVAAWKMDNALKSGDTGGSNPWPVTNYCNVWVAPLENGLAGYAQMPGGPELTDGIVLNSAFFARAEKAVEGYDNYALGRTLVHLMGSYLNLHELWNEMEPCGDDYVDDTPIHNAPNHGKGQYMHVSVCDGNPVEMTMNLMDSGFDSTMYMFTHGQVFRMHAQLSEGGIRHKLTQTAVICKDGENITDNNDRSINDTPKGTMALRILPNPNAGAFTIEIIPTDLDQNTVRTELYDNAGRLIWSTNSTFTPGNTLRFPFQGQRIAPGFYVVKAIAGTTVQTTQVVVR